MRQGLGTEKNQDNFPPSLFLVGAQKAGTTSLANYLNQHPKIILSSPKETHYLTSAEARTENWYKKCYNDYDRASILLDASTSYTMLPLSDKSLDIDAGRKKLLGVARKIKKLSPDAKIVYLIRDPVKRVFSHYVHYLRAQYEHRNFLDALANDPLYLEVGYYAKQIKPYFDLFDKSNIRILFFEDFIKDPIKIVSNCFEFVGLEPAFHIQKSKPKNEGFVFGKVGNTLNQGRFLSQINHVIPEFVKPVLKKILTKKPPVLSDEERVYLNDFYRLKNLELEEMLDLDIKCWGEGNLE